jgi:hypothetical protein
MKRYLLVLLLILGLGNISAQGLFESAVQSSGENDANGLQIGGFIRGSAYGAGEEYDFTNVFGEVSLRTKLKKEKFIVNSDLRFREGFNFNNPSSIFELKEAYAGISTSSFDLLIGEQIISWGRADGFNPTNNITPNNYFFLSGDPDDQKIPNFLLKSDIRFSPSIEWEIIAIPMFRPSEYMYDLFNMGDNVSFTDAVLPERSIKNSSLATKVDFELSKIGFSVSWFNGYDPFYGFDVSNIDFGTGSPVITNQPSFYRKNSFGVDLAIPAGSWIIRGEGAYNLTENDEKKIYVPNSDINYTVGLEHNFWGFTAILQYIGKYTLDYSDLIEPVLADPTNPMAQMQYANDLIIFESAHFNRKIFHQQEETNHALSLTVTKNFAYETVTTELTGFYDITSEEYMFRPKVSWKIGDSLEAAIGCSYMNGPDESVFSYASPIMNGAFFELKVSF